MTARGPAAGVAGKVVVITGSGRGLGRAYARRLAARGAHVVVGDIDAAAAHETAELVRSNGWVAAPVEVDVSDERAVTALVEQVLDRWGVIDALVNNAGVNLTAGTPMEDVSSAQWSATLAVNLTGAWLCTQGVVPQMKRQGSGAIVNISSTLVSQGAPPLSAAYVAAKGGIVGLTRALAKELGPCGIRVNAVAPGLIPMDKGEDPAKASLLRQLVDQVVAQQGLRRIGQAEDLCGVVEFLVSDEAAFITGQVINVDGGGTLV